MYLGMNLYHHIGQGVEFAKIEFAQVNSNLDLSYFIFFIMAVSKQEWGPTGPVILNHCVARSFEGCCTVRR